MVQSYEAALPVFYAEGRLADYELDPAADILRISRSIQYRTTVYQDGADWLRIGGLSLRLDATQMRWLPGIGWMQSDRDHILTVTTDAGHKLWRGYATGVKMTGDAGADWTFASEYGRLDDISIAGDPDEARAAVPAQEILDEARAQLPIFPAVDAQGWFDVYRPEENASARDYLASLLAAQGKILVFDSSADLEVRDIAARPADDPLTVRDDDLTKCRVVDDKAYMYNTVSYAPHNGERTVYTGPADAYVYPGNFLHRYGRREIGMNLEHLSAADARRAAQAQQSRLIRPRRRAVVELPDPGRQVLLLDPVRLELDFLLHTAQPLWGDFLVSAVKINTATDTIELELEEIL